MDFERFVRLGLLFTALATLVLGGVFHAQGLTDYAARAFATGTAIVLASLVIDVIRSLAKGEVGLDLVALASMAGCLFIGEYLAGNVVALMLTGGQMLEDYARARARREMTALLSRAPRSAQRYEQGGLREVPIEAIKPGDLLLVRPGETVPVDGLVSDGARAMVDEAALTGESIPVAKEPGDPVMSGSVNEGGAFDLTATATAARSTYAGIVRLVESAQDSKAPMSRLADRYALGFLAVTLALSAAAYVIGGEIRALAVLVVATPCPLILAVPVAIVSGMSRAAKRGVLVKNGGALEAMAQVRVLCLDKTGTLTSGDPVLVSVETAPGRDTDAMLALAGALAQGSSHVVSVAVTAAARAKALSLPVPRDVDEHAGAGITGHVDGLRLALGEKDFVLDGAPVPDWAHGAQAGRDEGGLLVFLAINGEAAAMLRFEDPRRPDAAASLEAARAAGVNRIVIITGDRLSVAKRVSEGLPIDRIVAGVTPQGKVEAVAEESAHGTAMMVGDGVNDAPALAAAQVGVALGARGATASSEAADVVVLVDSLARIPEGLRIAQRAFGLARQSVLVGLGLSLAGMTAALLGYLTPLAGALLQEAIDVAVILNALRALSGENSVRRH
ncbi:heavy metal translocating P-type ATPase [Rhizobiales bacterium TNE-4]|nr:heavy metal translocating P-type ATPase [Rhizobiales bacterium TNE-4]MBV1826833.1 heavy metal translocating P-type ATPase [Rhizobiales bacterium TNE-4]